MNEINNLLDATLDDLEDLPEFKPFPPGAHQVTASLSLKEINKKQCVELEMKMIETLEVSDSNDAPAKAGDSCSTIFMLDNEYGRGNLKKVATPLGTALDTGILREIIEQAKDIECVVITSLRTDKNDKDKKYIQVKELTVV